MKLITLKYLMNQRFGHNFDFINMTNEDDIKTIPDSHEKFILLGAESLHNIEMCLIYALGDILIGEEIDETFI